MKKIIVCGAGRVGQQIALKLAAEGHDVTVVDNDGPLIQKIEEEYQLTGMQGHAAHPRVLRWAGAEEAEAIIAATRTDEVNMVTCQVAHTKFFIPFKMARIRTLDYQEEEGTLFRREHMPVDKYFFPESDVAIAIGNWLSYPDTSEVIRFLDNRIRLVGVQVPVGSPVADQELERLTGLNGLFEDLDAIVVAAWRNGENVPIDRSTKLEEGDQIYFVAEADKVKRPLELFLGDDITAIKRMLIIGGGNIGIKVAELAMNELGIEVEIVERDRAVAEQILRQHVHWQVTAGDATEGKFLREIRADLADAIVTVTDNNAVNLIAGALARTRPEQRILALVTDDSLRPVAGQLGIDAVIDPAPATISPVLSNIRDGHLYAVHNLQAGCGQIIEALVLDNSRLEGKQLQACDLPKGCRVGAIMGGNQELKRIHSEVVFELKDRVVLFVTDELSQEVTKLFRAGISLF